MKDLYWQDIIDIAIELSENFEEIDPQWISFPDLHTQLLLHTYEGHITHRCYIKPPCMFLL